MDPIAIQDKSPIDSVFEDLGFRTYLDQFYKEIQSLYLENSLPWVLGYSGGKDSTAVVQLVWHALSQLSEEQRNFKKVYIISTDTLVENPLVAQWVRRSHFLIEAQSKAKRMPFEPHMLEPELNDSFWVNLLGRGYPAPRPKFRWCTDRLKISPSNRFIYNVVNNHGEAILGLGTRKAESQLRARTMERHERHRTRDRLSPNGSIPNCLVYTPIEDWSNDDVWLYLMRTANPWGLDNQELLDLYLDASPDRECPLVVDTSTPSCGASRFGCWICTMVARDKSMEAMISNDEEKQWLMPLMEFRKNLDVKNDRGLRDFRRLSGNVQLFHDEAIHGPYLQSTRELFLEKLLIAQKEVQSTAPDGFRNIELITFEELQEIRRIWLTEKHEIEDRLPQIYKKVIGKDFPDANLQYHHNFGEEELEILGEICGEDRLGYEMLRELIDLEWNYRTKLRRAGLRSDMENIIRKTFYTDEEDAVDMARKKTLAKKGQASKK
jgi:DNA sulfur modification protein DndC